MKHVIIKFILATGSFFTAFSLQAQVYTAGTLLSTYVDVNPDTLINCSYLNPNESYYFDLNGDFINDLELHASYVHSASFMSAYISINPLNSNSYISFGKIDSAYNPSSAGWVTARVAKPLNYGDTINSSQAIWDHNNLYLTDSYFVGGTSLSVSDWSTSTDQYIGVKYQSATDSIFGWIRVNCQTYGCTVKDYSFNALTLNVEELSSLKVVVYPNPASDKIYIRSVANNSIELELFDIVGKQVIAAVKSENELTEFNVSGLPDGAYFLKIQNDKGVVNKKVIIRH
ncbi:MAG: hypothetical protein JWP12_1726 [Bacteroidetes bacterium]|nr:hypothetical protein [Bacteroidota bacterium]